MGIGPTGWLEGNTDQLTMGCDFIIDFRDFMIHMQDFRVVKLRINHYNHARKSTIGLVIKLDCQHGKLLVKTFVLVFIMYNFIRLQSYSEDPSPISFH